VTFCYETCERSGAGFVQRVKAARRNSGSTWLLDEMCVSLLGEPYIAMGAVDEHGSELDILLQKRREGSMSRTNVHGLQSIGQLRIAEVGATIERGLATAIERGKNTPVR
jgi:transposase-like protein